MKYSVWRLSYLTGIKCHWHFQQSVLKHSVSCSPKIYTIWLYLRLITKREICISHQWSESLPMSRRIYKVVYSQVCYGQPTSWTTVNPYLYCRILCYIMLYCVLLCCSLQNCSIEFYRYVISCSLMFTVPLQWTFSHRLKWIASWQILLALHVHSCSLATLMLLSPSRLHKNNMSNAVFT